MAGLSTAAILSFMQLILSFGNLCILGYALFKFLNKPHDTLENKVSVLEAEIAAIKISLMQGNNRFKDQDATNKVIIHSLLALIEFEIQYCLTEHKELSTTLEQAKNDLHNFLSNRSLPL